MMNNSFVDETSVKHAKCVFDVFRKFKKFQILQRFHKYMHRTYKHIVFDVDLFDINLKKLKTFCSKN